MLIALRLTEKLRNEVSQVIRVDKEGNKDSLVDIKNTIDCDVFEQSQSDKLYGLLDKTSYKTRTHSNRDALRAWRPTTTDTPQIKGIS